MIIKAMGKKIVLKGLVMINPDYSRSAEIAMTQFSNRGIHRIWQYTLKPSETTLPPNSIKHLSATSFTFPIPIHCPDAIVIKSTLMDTEIFPDYDVVEI